MARRKFFNRRGGMLAGAGAVLALTVVATMAMPQTDARADLNPARFNYPIIAGSAIDFGQGNICTAGLVLKATGWTNNFTDYQQAVRYVLTAGHCGEVGREAKLQSPRASSGEEYVPFGSVIWKSSTADLMLVKVEPFHQNRQVCGFTSATSQRCWISNYTPRAVGRVLMSRGAVPVPGTKVPGDNEVFCISGKVTGLNCSYHTVPLPAAAPQLPGLKAAEAFAGPTGIPGDSGAPVIDKGGNIIGILRGGGNPEGNWPTVMLYTGIAEFLRQQPGYALAPSS